MSREDGVVLHLTPQFLFLCRSWWGGGQSIEGAIEAYSVYLKELGYITQRTQRWLLSLLAHEALRLYALKRAKFLWRASPEQSVGLHVGGPEDCSHEHLHTETAKATDLAKQTIFKEAEQTTCIRSSSVPRGPILPLQANKCFVLIRRYFNSVGREEENWVPSDITDVQWKGWRSM